MNEQVFIGIDPGFQDTAIIALYPDGEIIEKHISIPSNEEHPIVKYGDAINDVIYSLHYNVSLYPIVGIEEPAGRFNGNGIKVAYAFALVVYEVSCEYGTDYVKIYRPGQIKKFVTGKGNAKKDTIIKEVYKRWGFDTDNHNTADAYAIARLVESEAANG